MATTHSSGSGVAQNFVVKILIHLSTAGGETLKYWEIRLMESPFAYKLSAKSF